MNLGNTEDPKVERQTALDRLFQDDDGLTLAPELDAHDEDVVDLEMVRSSFFPAVVDTEPVEEAVAAEMPAEECAEAPAEPASDAPLRSRPRSPRTPASPDARPTPRRRSERLLVGLFVANTLVVGVLLLAPQLFGSAAESTESDGLARAVPDGAVRRDRAQPALPTAGGVDASGGAGVADLEVYEAAQIWIGRGYYDRATTVLTNYLKTHPDLSPVHTQAIYSSLAYCAEQLEDSARAAFFTARVRDARRLAATSNELLTEAAQATSPTEQRALHARLLLRQAAESAHARGISRLAIGETYRVEAAPAKGSSPESVR